MMPFLKFHALAASRGDGLRPELLALFEKLEMAGRPQTIAVEDRSAIRPDTCAEPETPSRQQSFLLEQ